MPDPIHETSEQVEVAGSVVEVTYYIASCYRCEWTCSKEFRASAEEALDDHLWDRHDEENARVI